MVRPQKSVIAVWPDWSLWKNTHKSDNLDEMDNLLYRQTVKTHSRIDNMHNSIKETEFR